MRILLFCLGNSNAETRSVPGVEGVVTAQADIKTSTGANLVAAEGVVWDIFLRSTTHLFSPLSSSSVFEQLVLLISTAVGRYGLATAQLFACLLCKSGAWGAGMADAAGLGAASACVRQW